MTTTTGYTNIAARFSDVAARYPDKVAVIAPKGAPVSFRALAALTDRYAHALTGYGVRRGMRVALMVTVGVDLSLI